MLVAWREITAMASFTNLSKLALSVFILTIGYGARGVKLCLVFWHTYTLFPVWVTFQVIKIECVEPIIANSVNVLRRKL